MPCVCWTKKQKYPIRMKNMNVTTDGIETADKKAMTMRWSIRR